MKLSELPEMFIIIVSPEQRKEIEKKITKLGIDKNSMECVNDEDFCVYVIHNKENETFYHIYELDFFIRGLTLGSKVFACYEFLKIEIEEEEKKLLENPKEVDKNKTCKWIRCFFHSCATDYKIAKTSCGKSFKYYREGILPDMFNRCAWCDEEIEHIVSDEEIQYKKISGRLENIEMLQEVLQKITSETLKLMIELHEKMDEKK